MSPEEFQKTIADNAETINAIKDSAHNLHANVNQHYDGTLPYGFHLDMVADSIYKYGDEVCADADDVLPLFFGAYYHDSIEDARLTYNDVIAEALRFMDKRQALVAAEIVYALTNDKGRTRAQRAGAKYYRGIRKTPYAPFMKLADRLANITYSCQGKNENNCHMREVYRRELPHFLEAIDCTRCISEKDKQPDCRFSLPKKMIEKIENIINSSISNEN